MMFFYTEEKAAELERKEKASMFIALAVIMTGLIACIVTCTQVRTINARALLYAIIITSSLTGWISQMLLRYRFFPLRSEARHMRGILKEAETEYTGIIKTDPVSLQIPKSIRINKVTLHQQQGSVVLNINHRFVSQMPKDGTCIRVKSVLKYITAFEVYNENN